tara:strand:+ start:261 stop:1016 length:756 start_codon:yes stop_codon:yes gene_type:complete
MNTWNVARWMSEGKKVFNAVTTGPKDAKKFGEVTRTEAPYFNCNTKHQTQGFRTVSGGKGNSHALTDSIIVDIRLRDTDDGFSYNANHAHQHAVELKITHDGETIYSWKMNGVQSPATNDWISDPNPKLITKPGKWKLYTRSIEEGTCGKIDGWKKVGEFTAKEAHEDCFMKYRQDTDELGVCGECLEGYTEVNGNCVADSATDDSSDGSMDGMGGSSGSSGGSTDNTTTYMIGGGILLLALVLRRRKSKE